MYFLYHMDILNPVDSNFQKKILQKLFPQWFGLNQVFKIS